MSANTPTKADLLETLDAVGEKVTEMLNPALTREEVIEIAQQLDELVNGADDDDDDEDDDDLEDDDSDGEEYEAEAA